MKRITLLLAAVVSASPSLLAAGAPAPQPPAVSAAADPMMKHAEMAGALEHLKEAKAELGKASGDYGGHRATALKHAGKAINETEAGIKKAAADQAPPAVVGGDKDKHPEMCNALKHLQKAKKLLEKSDNDAGGHRMAAIGHTDAAIAEVEAGLKLVD